MSVILHLAFLWLLLIDQYSIHMCDLNLVNVCYYDRGLLNVDQVSSHGLAICMVCRISNNSCLYSKTHINHISLFYHRTALFNILHFSVIIRCFPCWHDVLNGLISRGSAQCIYEIQNIS